jgi:hypothetical protein
MKTGIEIISEERQRQISIEGWTPEHDDKHENAELTKAAIVYADYSGGLVTKIINENYRLPRLWPWDKTWWKPSKDPVRNLAKAGALIAAEIDRLQRLNNG